MDLKICEGTNGLNNPMCVCVCIISNMYVCIISSIYVCVLSSIYVCILSSIYVCVYQAIYMYNKSVCIRVFVSVNSPTTHIVLFQIVALNEMRQYE